MLCISLKEKNTLIVQSHFAKGEIIHKYKGVMATRRFK